MKKDIILSPDYHIPTDGIISSSIRERINAGPKKTKITISDYDTGEVLGEYENKVLISGSILSAVNNFDLKMPSILPSYNKELGLDHTAAAGTTPKNRPFICLFGIGDSGCGTREDEVFVAKYTDRIDPKNDLMPFRYVNKNNDLNSDLRKVYFGRKTISSKNKIAYYFKTFDTIPELHIRYTDGTEITSDFYKVETTQTAECYVTTRLLVNRLDFRDYMEQVIGWDKARISTLSLCYAWYDDTIDDYKWYQDIYPYTKLNFSFERLVDLTKAIAFTYSIYY